MKMQSIAGINFSARSTAYNAFGRRPHALSPGFENRFVQLIQLKDYTFQKVDEVN